MRIAVRNGGARVKGHLRNAWYIAKHKWFVLRAGLQIGGVPLWRLLVHDWSKLTPSEWMAYVNHFHRGGAKVEAGKPYFHDPSTAKDAFNRAWERHCLLHPHHWQHWIYADVAGEMKPLEMPETYVREMVADWVGAGQAQGFSGDLRLWWAQNSHRTVLHPRTRTLVEILVAWTAKRYGDAG